MHKIDSFQLAKDTAASEHRMLASPQDWNAKKGMSQLLSHHQACEDNFVKKHQLLLSVDWDISNYWILL